MSSAITYYKRLIGREDINYGSGTFNRLNSIGGYETITKLEDPLKYFPEYPEFGGVDGTDDQVQINAALEKWGICLLKPTTYTVSDTINVPSLGIIQGFGKKSIIESVASNTNDIINNSDTTNGNSNILLSDFKIDGQGETLNLIRLLGTANSGHLLRNLWLYDADGYPLYMENDDELCNLIHILAESNTNNITYNDSAVFECYDDNVGTLLSATLDSVLLWF